MGSATDRDSLIQDDDDDYWGNCRVILRLLAGRGGDGKRRGQSNASFLFINRTKPLWFEIMILKILSRIFIHTFKGRISLGECVVELGAALYHRRQKMNSKCVNLNEVGARNLISPLENIFHNMYILHLLHQYHPPARSGTRLMERERPRIDWVDNRPASCSGWSKMLTTS